MPRGGAYTVSDLPRDRLCRIACARCGRVGAYRPATLAARFGDMALPDALAACEPSVGPAGQLGVNFDGMI